MQNNNYFCTNMYIVHFLLGLILSEYFHEE